MFGFSTSLHRAVGCFCQVGGRTMPELVLSRATSESNYTRCKGKNSPCYAYFGSFCTTINLIIRFGCYHAICSNSEKPKGHKIDGLLRSDILHARTPPIGEIECIVQCLIVTLGDLVDPNFLTGPTS